MRRLSFASLLLLSMFCCAAAMAQVLSRSSLSENPDLMPGETRAQWVIEVGPAVRLTASVEVTTKGNGTLNIGNLHLRVVDAHDDGAKYQNGMAHVEFVDVDGDGWKDVVVIGIVDYTDEKSDAVRKREPFTFIYRYDPKNKVFRQTYKHATFLLEDGPKSQSQ